MCVGLLEDGDRVAIAALRELDEETGFGPDVIEAFYDLDLGNQFHEPSYDAIVTAAVFAVRVLNDAEPTLSQEHDDARWVPVDEAHADVVWRDIGRRSSASATTSSTRSGPPGSS